MIRKVSFAALALLSCTGAVAATDSRIRTLAYNPDQIVRILGKPGIQSTIQFGDDERIENVAVGDSSAWQITPNHRADLLFVKPLVARTRTNMTVVTDHRTYMFDLVAEGKTAPAMYALKFSYPGAKGTHGASQPVQQAVAATQAQQQQQPSAVLAAEKLHFGWKSKGNGKLLPSRVFDDGSSLYLVWGKDTPLPAILTVSEDRKEGPVNYRMSGEYIVVSPIPANLMLRYGSKYALLWPTRQIANPQPRATSATSQIAAAPAQQPVASQPAPQSQPARTSHSVRLANMTSLYSDKLTDNQHDR